MYLGMGSLRDWPQLVISLLVMSLMATAPVHADLADDFLKELRQRGWHDSALEYLETASQDPLASPTFLKKIAYERASTQATLARQTASKKERQTLFAAATENFLKFAKQKTFSPQQLQALATAGNLLAEQALQATSQAEQLPKAARRQREQLLSTARDFLDQAKTPLNTLQEVCIAKLKTLPKAAARQRSPQATALQRQLLAKQAEARFLLAKIDFETSRTQAPQSSAQQQTLKTAAAAFSQLYEDYDEKVIGFYGRLYEGRCYQAGGDYPQALKCYWDLVDQPPIANQDFRRLVARAYRYRAECHFTSSDIEKIIAECGVWLAESTATERTQPAWLAVAYQLASAYERQVATLDGNAAGRARSEARKLFREIAKVPGEFQTAARAKRSAGAAVGKPLVTDTFDAATRAGKDALEQMNSAKLAVRLAEENNPSATQLLAQQVTDYQTAALEYFRQAIRLADQQTDSEQLAAAQYQFCWLLWEAARFSEAAVVGEFVAQRYPESKYAPTAAKFALAAYERLYHAARQADASATDFESQQLAAAAEILALRWPESPAAAAGLNLLINLALRDNRLAEAQQLLERVPPTSRTAAELRLGGTLWTRYQQTKSASTETESQALLQKANQRLAGGYQTLQTKSQVSAAEATGVLYYAQLLLARGEARQAIEVIEHPQVGPLSFASQQAANKRFEQEAYKVALRAYVSVAPPERKKSQQMMTSLESTVAGQANAEQQLINTYVSLGLQLQQQINALSTAGQTDQARAVAEAFEDLLARVTQRAGSANNWKVQNWIAHTNLQLAQGLRGADAARYYGQASEAYQNLLRQAKKEPKFAPSPTAILSAQKKLADCQLFQKNFTDAYQNYTSILRDKPKLLELQQAAAITLLKWGVEEQDVQNIEASIRGALPQANKKNLVWGWLRLASIADQAQRKMKQKASDSPAQARQVEKFQNLFFEARLHAIEARFAAAKLAQGAQRQKQLRTAKQSLLSMQQLYPDLGGPRWQAAYQQLLKQMEQEQ